MVRRSAERQLFVQISQPAASAPPDELRLLLLYLITKKLSCQLGSVVKNGNFADTSLRPSLLSCTPPLRGHERHDREQRLPPLRL